MRRKQDKDVATIWNMGSKCAKAGLARERNSSQTPKGEDLSKVLVEKFWDVALLMIYLIRAERV